MEVYILLECIDQSDYTEGHYYSSAYDATSICGVYSSLEGAKSEKEKLELRSAQLEDELDTDPCYYTIQTYQVQ